MTDTYSIWFLPESDTKEYDQLSDVIGEYASTYSSGPGFEPHVTVVGGIEGEMETTETATRRIASGLDSFDISFSGVTCSTTRHQCVFLLVEPTAELLSTHVKARRSFGIDEEFYIPHLSLLYSDMGIPGRLQLVESIEPDALPETARIDRIALVDTSGPVEDWDTVVSHVL